MGSLYRIHCVAVAVGFAAGLLCALAAGPARARDEHIHISAYWWDGWFEGSPFIREPLTTRFKDREPIWGWSDDSQEAVDTSIRFAARHGLDSFAFLWYPEAPWRAFLGRPLGVMNNGLRYYLSSKIPERERVGFYLMVATPPTAEEWEATCRTWVGRYLTHERCVRVEGRPLLSFYRLETLAERLGGREKVRPALERLRQIAREEKCPDPFLVLRAARQEAEALQELGFDGATDYAIAYTTPGEHPYSDLVALSEAVWRKYAARQRNYIPSITSGWDGRPREWMKKDYYGYWFRRSPAEFGAFVRKGLDWIRAHPPDVPKTPMLMIYAWNEVDEGGWICPTKAEGAAYLEALQAAAGDRAPDP